MERAHLFISGMVQGVFFRAETKRVADNIGLKGWVRNLADGKVEILIEGNKNDIERMIEFCKKGPDGARVDNVDIKKEDFRAEFNNFSIRY